ncbi:hypothetical protein [Hyalangium sp.]|uniref:hypothetical protein n=1 Tax=Hyalangium sp. TaxID=2028555 RepID=UPI002D6B601F|nr:hypothetical protein [Hyalangium sp.]HYI02586.1 hypothetical protein [Hyalangium sp.]
MNVRLAWSAALAALFVSGCAARSSQLPGLEMRFYESPADGVAKKRIHEEFTLNATLLGDASLRYLRPSELLKAAETGSGQGDPQKLMRAARTLVPGEGVVLLGTVRSAASGGGSANLAIYSLALACEKTNLDQPGDLRGCKGYVLRVTRTWPAEVYAIQEATVSLIAEGGTAHGRIRAKSEPGAFKAELEGEFAASIVELSSSDALGSDSAR